jgi:polyisoprenoid-binding protein YceI
VGSWDRAPDRKPESRPEPKAAPVPLPATTRLRLRLMEGRCVGGFDGTSPVLNFSGWTRHLAGELTYEKGRLAETARGTVTADPATLDTGDAARDKEIREKLLETARYPRMSFEISFLEMKGPDSANISGTMEIHGRKQYVTIPCSFRLRRDGYAWMKGELKVKMSDFGIDPPVKMGVIKVRDRIRIWFEVWAEPVREANK